MQTAETIPEFLCYRYKGVRRVDQILANPVHFGWKCRKYQNWKEIQNAPDDKQLLLKFADALIDRATLSIEYFGRISGIFYNVQRWRKDKQELADEPDPLPGWVELESLLNVVAENPRIVIQRLEKEIPHLNQIPPSALWELFYGWTIQQMLKAHKMPGVPDFDTTVAAEKEKLDHQVGRLIHFLYSSVGLTCPALPNGSSVQTLISRACEELGFPAPRFDYVFESADLAHGPPPKGIVIRYAKLGPLQLMKAAEVEGHIHLVINEDHEFAKAAAKEERTKALLETFLSALAEAIQKLPAQKDTLDALTSYLGVILKRKNNPKS